MSPALHAITACLDFLVFFVAALSVLFADLADDRVGALCVALLAAANLFLLLA